MSWDPITGITDLVKTGLNKFLPDKMSETDRAKLNADMTQFMASEATKANSVFRKFILEYEGSMKDYKDVPYIGKLVLVFRGLIRPVFTIGVGYWDYLYFTAGNMDLWTPEKASLLKAINLIVLIFWFGERAAQNSGLMDMLKGKLGG